MEEIKGCAHLYIKNGKPVRLVTHLSNMPLDGVIHLKGDKAYSEKEFSQSHPQDIQELEIDEEGIIVSKY